MTKVWRDIEALDIDVFECPFRAHVAIASCDGCIGYDPNKTRTSAELNAVLSHEVGHFLSGAFYWPDSRYEIKERAEYRAKKAAVKRYIPYAELLACLESGITSSWELADHFGYTEDFIRLAIEIYKLEGKLEPQADSDLPEIWSIPRARVGAGAELSDADREKWAKLLARTFEEAFKEDSQAGIFPSKK